VGDFDPATSGGFWVAIRERRSPACFCFPSGSFLHKIILSDLQIEFLEYFQFIFYQRQDDRMQELRATKGKKRA
jgi:hypothetical protein